MYKHGGATIQFHHNINTCYNSSVYILKYVDACAMTASFKNKVIETPTKIEFTVAFATCNFYAKCVNNILVKIGFSDYYCS